MGIGNGSSLKPAVFFDRDGVLNEAVVVDGRPYPPASPDEVRIDPSAGACIAQLRRAGFSIFIVTNQPDVARGKTERETVDAINARLTAALAVDAVYVCYHDDPEACACRKPKPGMLLMAASEHGIDLARSYLIGDRWSDVAAGEVVGCRTIWLERGYAERQPDRPDARVSTLTAACNWILHDRDRSQ